MKEAKETEFRRTFVVAAVNSAAGFLNRAAATAGGRPELAIGALEGARDWIDRALVVLRGGGLPDELSPPALRASADALPLEPLDGGTGGA